MTACAPQLRADDISAEMISTPELIEGFARADHPREFTFPTDFGPHFDFQTEWWYYTGNLETKEGRHFGYELTFFRRALAPPDVVAERSSDWSANHIYMAHFVITDVDHDEFHAFERFSRGAAGLAGAENNPYHVWLEDWFVRQTGPNQYELFASSEELEIRLEMTDEKGAVLQGNAGLSRKGPQAGNASYYYSQTRLQSQGEVVIKDATFAVTGLSWKDHEISTSAMSEGQVGWDWFSIQLDNGYDVMLYQVRREGGGIDPFSSGTLIAPDGAVTYLTLQDFTIETHTTWRSPHSGATYPMGWTVRIPGKGLEIDLEPYLVDQELNLSFVYWEGAVSIAGHHAGQAVGGSGYVEMTGYSKPFAGDF
ncbi:MAG: lipocalin-like domain-containing protein [Anaerolineales bacterium]